MAAAPVAGCAVASWLSALEWWWYCWVWAVVDGLGVWASVGAGAGDAVGMPVRPAVQYSTLTMHPLVNQQLMDLVVGVFVTHRVAVGLGCCTALSHTRKCCTHTDRCSLVEWECLLVDIGRFVGWLELFYLVVAYGWEEYRLSTAWLVHLGFGACH
jgi:hypothetical protein